MPTDLPPDYKPNPAPPAAGEGKGAPGVPDPGADLPDGGTGGEPGGDVVDPVGWPEPALPGVGPSSVPKGLPTF